MDTPFKNSDLERGQYESTVFEDKKQSERSVVFNDNAAYTCLKITVGLTGLFSSVYKKEFGH